MTVFIFFAYGVVLLMALLIIVSLGVIAMNVLLIRKENSAREHRFLLRQMLLRYLSGEEDEGMVQKSIAGHEDLLTGVVVQLAEERGEEARLKLINLFDLPGLHYLADNELTHILSKNWHERQRAATYLPYVARSDLITQPLTRALEDEMLDVRLAAARSLAKLRITAAIVPILEHLAMPASWPVQRIIEIIDEMGSAASAPLLRYLSQPDALDAAKIAAISVLGMQRSSEATPQLLQLLVDADKDIRVQSAKALGTIGEREALEPLLRLMHDRDWEVRAASALALGLLKERAALPFLCEGLCDREWWVRYNSAVSLAGLGSEGIAALKNTLIHKDKFARDVSRLILQERSLIEFEQGDYQ